MFSPTAAERSTSSGSKESSTAGPIDSPSLAAHDDEEQIAKHYIGIGAGEPVRTRSSAQAMVSKQTEQGGVDCEEEKEKADEKLGFKLAIEKKVLHFTVSLTSIRTLFTSRLTDIALLAAAIMVLCHYGNRGDSYIAQSSG
jgi:hypothetical protein